MDPLRRISVWAKKQSCAYDNKRDLGGQANAVTHCDLETT